MAGRNLPDHLNINPKPGLLTLATSLGPIWKILSNFFFLRKNVDACDVIPKPCYIFCTRSSWPLAWLPISRGLAFSDWRGMAKICSSEVTPQHSFAPFKGSWDALLRKTGELKNRNMWKNRRRPSQPIWAPNPAVSTLTGIASYGVSRRKVFPLTCCLILWIGNARVCPTEPTILPKVTLRWERAWITAVKKLCLWQVLLRSSLSFPTWEWSEWLVFQHGKES